MKPIIWILALLALPALAQQNLCERPVNGVPTPVAPGSTGNPGYTPPMFGPYVCVATYSPNNYKTLAQHATDCDNMMCGSVNCNGTFEYGNNGPDSFQCKSQSGSQLFGGTCTSSPPTTWLNANPTKGCPAGSHRSGTKCETDMAPKENDAVAEEGGVINRNANGDVTSVTEGGKTWSVTSFDAGRRPTQVQAPDGRTITYAYQPNSARVASKTVDSGVTATYTYTTDGRVQALTMSNTGHQYIFDWMPESFTLSPNGYRLSNVRVVTGDPTVSGKPVQCGVPVENQVQASAKPRSWFPEAVAAVPPPYTTPFVQVEPSPSGLEVNYLPLAGEDVDMRDPFDMQHGKPVNLCQWNTTACTQCLQRCADNPPWKGPFAPLPDGSWGIRAAVAHCMRQCPCH